jgi:hypothetical protein
MQPGNSGALATADLDTDRGTFAGNLLSRVKLHNPSIFPVPFGATGTLCEDGSTQAVYRTLQQVVYSSLFVSRTLQVKREAHSA